MSRRKQLDQVREITTCLQVNCLLARSLCSHNQPTSQPVSQLDRRPIQIIFYLPAFGAKKKKQSATQLSLHNNILLLLLLLLLLLQCSATSKSRKFCANRVCYTLFNFLESLHYVDVVEKPQSFPHSLYSTLLYSAHSLISQSFSLHLVMMLASQVEQARAYANVANQQSTASSGHTAVCGAQKR